MSGHSSRSTGTKGQDGQKDRIPWSSQPQRACGRLQEKSSVSWVRHTRQNGYSLPMPSRVFLKLSWMEAAWSCGQRLKGCFPSACWRWCKQQELKINKLRTSQNTLPVCKSKRKYCFKLSQIGLLPYPPQPPS